MTNNALPDRVIDEILGSHKAHVAKLLRWLWSERGYKLANATVTDWVFRGVGILKVSPQPIKDRASTIRNGLTDILTLKPPTGVSCPELSQLTLPIVDGLTHLVVAVIGLRNTCYRGEIHDFMQTLDVDELTAPLERLRSALEEIS